MHGPTAGPALFDGEVGARLITFIFLDFQVVNRGYWQLMRSESGEKHYKGAIHPGIRLHQSLCSVRTDPRRHLHLFQTFSHRKYVRGTDSRTHGNTSGLVRAWHLVWPGAKYF
jgi:hypothetical protein